MRKIWNVKKQDVLLQKRLAGELDISTLLAQLLINRNITTSHEAENFLSCKLSSLHNPFLLKGIEPACVRIKKALRGKEKIVIWGDYDVDGLTALALLREVLTNLGGRVECYIPHRTQEGYGLNFGGAEKIFKEKTDLVITVDCGINSDKEVEFFNSVGIDVIITDHHHPLGDLPQALSIINPLQKGCGYPFKYLAGVGLAFKLSQALTGMQLPEHFDLVALGTICDVAPMTGENRIFVKHGLLQLAKTRKAGLFKLLVKNGLENKKITVSHAGFLLGPRLNAAGRIGSAAASLRLLTTNSSEEAEFLAAQSNQNNSIRQKLEAGILKEALNKIEKEVNFKEHKVIILYQQDWHQGVMGIVASRLVEQFCRPAIMLSSDGKGFLKGSGRSIDNFHLFEALENCAVFLDKFGGHSKACGLSLKLQSLEDFKRAVNAYALNVISPECLSPQVDVDAEIPMSLLNEKLISQMAMLGPFGPENPRPVFATRGASLKTRPRIVGKGAIKMWVSDGDITCQAVGFKMGGILPMDEIPSVIDIVYAVDLNEWQGAKTIELNLKDVRWPDAERFLPSA